MTSPALFVSHYPAPGARRPGDRVVTLHEGFHHATLSMRCFSLEQAPYDPAPRQAPG